MFYGDAMVNVHSKSPWNDATWPAEIDIIVPMVVLVLLFIGQATLNRNGWIMHLNLHRAAGMRVCRSSRSVDEVARAAAEGPPPNSSSEIANHSRTYQ